MPRKPTPHQQLDALRQAAAQERVRSRDIEAQLEAAKGKVEQASALIAAAYAAEDERAIARVRKAEQQAIAELRDLQHRLGAARTLRGEAARRVSAVEEDAR